jgi:hypothetical protein
LRPARSSAWPGHPLRNRLDRHARGVSGIPLPAIELVALPFRIIGRRVSRHDAPIASAIDDEPCFDRQPHSIHVFPTPLRGFWKAQ